MADRYLSISFAQNTRYMSHYSQVIFREVFWHEYDKIPRHTGQNAITEGDLECILTRNCEGTEQLQNKIEFTDNIPQHKEAEK